MNYAYVTAGVVVAVAFIAYRLLKRGNGAPGGFREWLTNPDYRKAAADYFAAREALKVPDDISDDEIQKMVDRLYKKTDEDFNFDRLKLVGEKAVPMLIEALENPRTASLTFSDGGHAFDPKSPFERIVDLLQPIGPASAAKPLATYVQHKDDHFRKYAAIALGNIGTSECIAPMLLALDDADDYVRSYAMMGIQRGIDSKRCTKDFLDAMFPALTKLLNRDERSVSGNAPVLLLAIDTQRAMSVLLSPDFFTVNNRRVHYIIKALNAAGRLIPHDTLLPFIQTVKPLSGQYPHDYEYAEALLAYARNPDSSAEEIFRNELKSANKNVQEAAANALTIMSGITNAREVVFETLKQQGFDRLPPPQQHYYAVFMYDAEVCNGGHSQYFVNVFGDHWKLAWEGLKEMGASARAGVLQASTELFGPAGPSQENELRHQQIASFSKQQHKAINELDTRYYACNENIEALLAQYALKNKEHFVAQ